MSADEFVALGQPFIGKFLELYIGPFGASFIEVAIILSIFGAWISYTLMPTEAITYLADQKEPPAIFAKKNKYGVASFSLLLTTILAQIFYISMHWTEDAYNMGFSLSGSAILIVWVFVNLYQIQHTMRHRDDPGATKNMILGILGLVYYLFATFILGINYVVACFVLYLIDIPLFYWARKADVDLSPFKGGQKFLAIAALILAVVGIYFLLTGQV